MYNTIEEIPKFPFCGYKVNVGWGYIDEYLTGFDIVNLNPEYQRGYVWSDYQKERYIEYKLKEGIGSNVIFWNYPSWNYFDHKELKDTEWYKTLELVDGKQRLNAVSEFLNNKIKAFGKFKSEYPDFNNFKLRYNFEFHINNLVSKKEVIEWYLGLNNGGSVHTDEDLNIAKQLLAKSNL